MNIITCVRCVFPHRIDDFGMPFLVFFLKQCNTLTSLDVSNNNLGDYLCSDVLHCMVRPPLDFDEDDGNKHDLFLI